MEEKLRQQASDCLKIVLFGPQSTGKTTLANQLAAYYNTIVVPEYSRTYAQAKHKENKTLDASDILPIAIGQIALENTRTKEASEIVICDTDLLETKVYASIYYPEANTSVLDKYIQQNSYDFYFLTYIDVPWEADDIRDLGDQREAVFQKFELALQVYQKEYSILKGSKMERFEKAIAIIDKLRNK